MSLTHVQHTTADGATGNLKAHARAPRAFQGSEALSRNADASRMKANGNPSVSGVCGDVDNPLPRRRALRKKAAIWMRTPPPPHPLAAEGE